MATPVRAPPSDDEPEGSIARMRVHRNFPNHLHRSVHELASAVKDVANYAVVAMIADPMALMVAPEIYAAVRCGDEDVLRDMGDGNLVW